MWKNLGMQISKFQLMWNVPKQLKFIKQRLIFCQVSAWLDGYDLDGYFGHDWFDLDGYLPLVYISKKNHYHFGTC